MKTQTIPSFDGYPGGEISLGRISQRDVLPEAGVTEVSPVERG